MQKSFVIVGSALIFLALVWAPLLALTIEVVYTSVEVKTTNPASGDVNSPTPLFSGSYTLKSTISDPSDEADRISCEITTVSGGPFSETVTLAWSSWAGGDLQRYAGSWTVPTLTETVLKFHFRVLDAGGNQIVTKDAYGILGVYPDGYFTINGAQVGSTDVLYVTDPTLAFEFYATKGGNYIDKVGVLVYGVESIFLTEVTADTKWTGSYTLPAKGSYTLEGVVYIGTTGLTLMSMSMGWGEGENGGLLLDPVAMAFGVMGLACLAVGLLVPSKKKWR